MWVINVLYIYFFLCIGYWYDLKGHCQCVSQVGSKKVVWSIYLCIYHYIHDLPPLLQEDTCAVITPSGVRDLVKNLMNIQF